MSEQILKIDGAWGEGGGQILRSSLALSVCLGRPFVIENIRSKRSKPGLLRQHLTAVKAAARISDAEVDGAELGSQCLVFKPQTLQHGEFHFAIGSAGSTTLVLQTILVPLLFAKGASKIVIEGGTHNPMAPSHAFIDRVFIPALKKMGASVSVTLTRYGFFPAGGGQLIVEIDPVIELLPISMLERGKLVVKKAQILISKLPLHIAERELQVLKKHLNWKSDCFEIVEVKNSFSSANLVSVYLQGEHVNEVLTVFGERGLKAETVAKKAARLVDDFCAANVPVGEHLADQLLLPMALSGSGEFMTQAPSEHSYTNMKVIEQFLPLSFSVVKHQENQVIISISEGASASEGQLNDT